MAKKKVFTFKNDKKETGLRRIGNYNVGADVKLNGLQCAKISAPNWSSKDNLYHVMIAVTNDEGGWNWITLKKSTATLQEMKDWLKENTEVIVEKYNLHFFEKDN